MLVNIIINYKNTSRVNEYIKHVMYGKKNFFDKIYLVDNSQDFVPDNFSSTMLKEGKVNIIVPEFNLGYFGGANLALKNIDRSLIDSIVVSNVDVKIITPVDLFRSELMSLNSDSVIFSPLTFNNQNIFYSTDQLERASYFSIKIKSLIFSNVLTLTLYEIYCLIRYKLHNFFKKFFRHNPLPQYDYIYAPCGCFVIFNKSYFDLNFNFSYPFFMYGEEIYLAELCKKNNLKIRINKNIKIIHEGYNTTLFYKNSSVLKYKREAMHGIYNLYFK
ncbi:hypothetical protein N9Y58_01675 [Alphaproteobacteria bacterium]|nr:hypothetical protein [Alphaproteobacteria bacterium]